MPATKTVSNAGKAESAVWPIDAGRWIGSIEALHADVLIVNDAFRIVRLKGESAFGKSLATSGRRNRGFVVFDDVFTIDLHGDLAPPDDDVLGPPLVVPGGGKSKVRQAVKAPGFDPLALAHIYLAFDARAR